MKNIRVDEYTVIGVLETTMFPASFYAGIVRYGANGWYPADNETSLYHRTKKEAETAAIELAEYLKALK
jgi:hypothetical protein